MARVLVFCCFLFLFGMPVCAQQRGAPYGLIISEQLRSTFTLVGSGARAAGMGGAFTAVADDATAASFNPAGLAQLILPEASLVFDRARLNDGYQNFVLLDPEGPIFPLTDSTVRFARNDFNFLSLTLPLEISNRRWAIQFSTQKAVDLTYHADRLFSVTDSGNPIIDIHQQSDQAGGIRLYSGSLAFSATRRMLLGITINRWKGNWRFDGLNAEKALDDPAAQTDFLTYTQTNLLSGWNYDLGILLRYKYGNVGVRYRSHFTADYRLKAVVDTNIVDEPAPPLPDTKARLEWPSTFNLGASIKPNDRLTVALDFGRTDWSAMVFDASGETGKVNFFDLQTSVGTLVSVAHDWRAGAEYIFFLKSAVLPVRAGWFYEPQPGVDVGTGKRFISKGLTVGTGIKFHWFAMDFAYQRTTSSTAITLFEPDDLVINDLTNPLKGTVRRSENRFFFSTILQLPRNTSLGNLIHTIFVGPASSSD